tara:strand:+ start:1141 stop:2037 length:897 start_codon:yes stop_codon:yes gene_type:complete
MKLFFKIFSVLFLVCFPSLTISGNSQNIILTGSQKTGSYIFVKELARIWENSVKDRKEDLVPSPETSLVTRLRKLENNRVTGVIIDAETAYLELEKFPGLQVLSILWSNWLIVLGKVLGSNLNLSVTKTMLVHENSLYFARAWNSLVPETNFNWFNSNKLPVLSEGFPEDNLIFTAPVPLKEINYLLDQFPGIKLLSLDERLVKTLRSKFNWLVPKKFPANIFLYHSKPIQSVIWHPVMVVRKDFPISKATKLLQLIYAQRNSLIPHPLFHNLRPTDNLPYQKIYAFHPALKSILKLK